MAAPSPYLIASNTMHALYLLYNVAYEIYHNIIIYDCFIRVICYKYRKIHAVAHIHRFDC